jgi:hypothetical protein
MMIITQDDIDKNIEYMNREICMICNDTGEVRDPVLFRWEPCKCKKEPKVVMKTVEWGEANE